MTAHTAAYHDCQRVSTISSSAMDSATKRFAEGSGLEPEASRSEAFATTTSESVAAIDEQSNMIRSAFECDHRAAVSIEPQAFADAANRQRCGRVHDEVLIESVVHSWVTRQREGGSGRVMHQLGSREHCRNEATAAQLGDVGPVDRDDQRRVIEQTARQVEREMIQEDQRDTVKLESKE